MTERDFIEFYCRPPSYSWAVLRQYLKPIPCGCGDADCKGWTMVDADEAREREEE